MSLMDLCLRRWYHCTVTQTAATTRAQFWNRPIEQREAAEEVDREEALEPVGK